MTVPTFSEYAEKVLRDHVRLIAADLRKLADSLDREAESKHPDSIASRVQHGIVWGVANLHLDGLTAKQVDYTRAVGNESLGHWVDNEEQGNGA